MALTEVLTGGIADDAIGNTKLALDADYAFTGTIRGKGSIAHTIGDVDGDGDPVSVSINISSVSNGAAGINTINLSTNMASTKEPCLGTCHHDSYNRNTDIQNHASAVPVYSVRNDNGAPTDTDFSICFFGDLA
tara:strand:- start:8 stop:409 length:402 start_codon:yes stop_codon:yes gene_type:complete